MVASYRGTYGNYPKRFMSCYLDLTPDGLVIRPMLFFGQFWRRIPVTEKITSARTRPFASRREAFGWRGTGVYAEGGIEQWSGMLPISCTTTGGVLEFTVARPDAELALHYLGRLAKAPGSDSPR